MSITCVHPLCNQESCGAVIHDRDVSKDHIDWAMSRAFAPMKEAFDKVFGTAPVEHKIEKRCPHDEQICRHECEGDDCWRELDGS